MAGKWVKVQSPEMPSAEFAEEVLRTRIQAVWDFLPLAAHNYRDDIEYVHQLRVSCRRADAALKSFQPLMQKKPLRLQETLREIRQAAGPARDADVLLQRLKSEVCKKPEHVYHEYLIARLKQHRKKVQKKLLEVQKRYSNNKLQKRLAKTLALLRSKWIKDEHQAISQYANWALQKASLGLLKQIKLEHPDIVQLHQLRISAKRLRYSIELFSGAFSSELRQEIYPLIAKIQSRLGRLNDHATAQALYQRWMTDLPCDSRAAYLAKQVVSEHESSLAIRKDFLKWWTAKRVASLETSLTELISEK